MELQLALDFVTLPGAKAILEEVGDSIDIAEVGTPFIVKEGVGAVREMRASFPKLKILADLKIMDAGGYETKAAVEAGADIVTVLAAADDATIRAAVAEAGKAGKRVMADMINVADVEKRAREVDRLGVDYICIHTASDVQGTGKNPLAELRTVKRAVKSAGIAVAGGIRLESIGAVIAENPAILIVGSGITGQPDKKQTAQAMKELIGKRRNG